ncbi:putative endonuclease [Port-miou virus]|uniref:Putative endonuclease n=1 Tax=Port-miou virus TaxID=1733873 RepID=A0A0N7G2D0_9VIRU|nr:putative endonuclease [Port-miou virus]
MFGKSDVNTRRYQNPSQWTQCNCFVDVCPNIHSNRTICLLLIENEKSFLLKGTKIKMDCATRKQGKLCGKKECEHCFRRCFASCKKSKCLAEGQKDPYLIAKYCNKKFSFVCPKCKHGFEAIVNNISKGKFCPYCATTNGKLCNSSDCEMCFKNSFASHAKAKCWSIKNKKTARQTFLYSDDKVWFDCDVCAHDFKTGVGGVSRGNFCPYCATNGKLCDYPDCELCFKKSFASHSKAKYWSDKNKKTARQTRLHSGIKAWFKCEKNHEFQSFVGNVSKGSWCLKCKHKTEALVFGFLKEHFENPKHQYKPRWCKNPKTGRSLPFDFCVSKTIIEVDGRQHYEQVSNWRSPEETQKNDRYKEECATKNGYSVFRISQRDIWNNKIDWKKLLLKCVRDYETPVIIHLPE